MCKTTASTKKLNIREHLQLSLTEDQSVSKISQSVQWLATGWLNRIWFTTEQRFLSSPPCLDQIWKPHSSLFNPSGIPPTPSPTVVNLRSFPSSMHSLRMAEPSLPRPFAQEQLRLVSQLHCLVSELHETIHNVMLKS
jgi:hypothetical protein